MVAAGGAGASPARAVGLRTRSQAAPWGRGAGPPRGLGHQCARPRGRCGVGPRSAAARGGRPAPQLPRSGPGVLSSPPVLGPEIRSPRPLETVGSAPSGRTGRGFSPTWAVGRALTLDSLTNGPGTQAADYLASAVPAAHFFLRFSRPGRNFLGHLSVSNLQTPRVSWGEGPFLGWAELLWSLEWRRGSAGGT